MKLSYSTVSIESRVPFVSIDSMELHAKINEHAQLQIRGILDQKNALDMIAAKMEHEVVRVTLPGGQVYFAGVIIKLEVKAQGELFQACITCASATFLLDIYQNDQSCQDVTQAYEDVIRKTFKKDKEVLFIIGKEAEKPIGEPVFQLHETDWHFVLRMAGKLRSYVAANYRTGRPAFALGENGNQETDWDVKDYTAGYTKNNGRIYRCTSAEQRDVGDWVLLDGHILVIVEKCSVFRNGEFINTYVLGTKDGFAVKNCEHSLKGNQIRGTVLDTKGEKIRLHLEIDEIQEPDKAYWFDYVPQTGNVMYCMPQKGTRAMLRFCSDQDSSAVVEICWRESGGICQNMVDYRKRYFTTEHGKRMAMLPGAVFFEGNDSRADLADRRGISFHSGRHITIAGEDRISIMASGACGLDGSRHIYITKPGRQSVIDFAANEINIDSVNTNLTIRNTGMCKPYKPAPSSPAVSMQARLARKVLAFVPKKSGKGKL